MTETITAEVITGRRPVEITLKEALPLASGAEKKRVITGSVGKKDVSFVEKVFDKEYVSKWRRFREVGLPVVPTLRKGSPETLLLTDLKADGSEIYGKAMYHALTDYPPIRERANTRIDLLFVQVTDLTVIKEIENKVGEYVALADANKIQLPYDDPFELLIHPNGSWELIILDLTKAEVFNADTNPSRISEVPRRNKDSAKNFLAILYYIRAELLKQI